MLGWFKRHWVLSILLLLMAVGSVPASLNYSGFCWEQKRWLSDEEFLLAMLGYREGDTIRNEERKKFLKDHPDCCLFSRGETPQYSGKLITFLGRIMGFHYSSGQVERKRSYEERQQNGWENDYYQRSFFINACGQSYHESGWAMTEKEHRENYERYLQNKDK